MLPRLNKKTLEARQAEPAEKPAILPEHAAPLTISPAVFLNPILPLNLSHY
jgi:hypothetical protein